MWRHIHRGHHLYSVNIQSSAIDRWQTLSTIGQALNSPKSIEVVNKFMCIYFTDPSKNKRCTKAYKIKISTRIAQKKLYGILDNKNTGTNKKIINNTMMYQRLFTVTKSKLKVLQLLIWNHAILNHLQFELVNGIKSKS